ncbi:MAG: NTP transferase domain-containing protein [Bacteroidetes bacterium]|nr:NTP transferase domain-containing protein [Bacteroidota bacterium]
MIDASSASSSLAAIIMAAGQGKRMNNPDKAKVMYELNGTPLIGHVVRLAILLGCQPIVAVVGHQRQSVIDYLGKADFPVTFAVQEQQLGTAHAVMATEESLTGFDGDIIILSGDAPLTRPETLLAALRKHKEHAAAVTVLTAVLPDASGYGRVIRDAQGAVLRIVEHKDANEEERAIREINSGIYIFNRHALFTALKRVDNDNAQGEYYLPDVFSIFRSEDRVMLPFVVDDIDEIRGINTLEQLEDMEMLYKQRQMER